MILSFGWTWAAFVALVKTATRRDWSPAYAALWKRGTEFVAYNRSPRFGGRPIGTGRLTQDALYEPLSSMPSSDYEAEGFAWLHEHPEALPKSARQQIWGDCTFPAFDRWRNSGGSLYVVRYEILTITDWARDELAKLIAEDRRAGEVQSTRNAAGATTPAVFTRRPDSIRTS